MPTVKICSCMLYALRAGWLMRKKFEVKTVELDTKHESIFGDVAEIIEAVRR